MFLFLIFLLPFSLFSLNHNLDLKCIPGSSKTFIVFHGMGGNSNLANLIKEYSQRDETFIGFNFPDADFRDSESAQRLAYGTLDEILPAIFVLKKVIIEEKISDVNLYGFSAGGGAIINTLAILNSSKYDAALGLSENEKKKILEVLSRGCILLDSPLKSVREIIDFRGPHPLLLMLAKQYQQNEMEPIDAISKLEGLSLHIIVYFQNPDDVLSNRDDELYIERLKKVNRGSTQVLIGRNGTHQLPHLELWNFYNSYGCKE